MSRTARLLELLIRVQTKPRFTAKELAGEFGVSRRTMLRDLGALSEMGVPLRSTPGPGGGYSLPRGGRRLSPSLTVDEALALIVSYEAFLRYSESPVGAENLSAVTKLRASLPPDVVGELDTMRRHVAVLEPVREYEAPLLGEIFRAAVEGTHLRIVYDSASGLSERVIYPFGVFASRGFWYCACHDYRRGKKVSLRADRFREIEPIAGFDRPPRVPLDEWVKEGDDGDGEALEIKAHVSERGMKSFELASLFGRIEADESGRINAAIPLSGIDFYAARLLSVGTDVIVESPPELVEAMLRKAKEVIEIYDRGSISRNHTSAGD
ncbi:MAG: helix-turn-helix transcriptional regulator [Rubrobacteraceae bacterium]